MSKRKKIRAKDWRRIAFAVVTGGGVFTGLTMAFGNLIASTVVTLMFLGWLLSLRPYLYLRHLVWPKANPLPDKGWGNYYSDL